MDDAVAVALELRPAGTLADPVKPAPALRRIGGINGVIAHRGLFIVI
jgi:hypothetical protein